METRYGQKKVDHANSFITSHLFVYSELESSINSNIEYIFKKQG